MARFAVPYRCTSLREKFKSISKSCEKVGPCERNFRKADKLSGICDTILEAEVNLMPPSSIGQDVGFSIRKEEFDSPRGRFL